MSERTIRLLEDRVSRVAQRIRELIAERRRLDQEVEALRERLRSLEREAAERTEETAIDWAEVSGVLRSAAEELRRN